MKNEVAGVSLGFPANFVPPSSLRKPIDFWCTMKVFKLDANASSVAGVCKGKLGYEHYGSEKVLTLVSTDMLRRIFNGFGNCLIRAKAYQERALDGFDLPKAYYATAQSIRERMT
ncbi:hypothetical protein Tco_0052113 [Tanacetum coccineum]